ncbi:MAG: HAMP domain-containing protein [Anaerolineales bacterium]
MRTFFAYFWRIFGAVSVRLKILGIVLGLVILFGAGLTIQVRRSVSLAMQKQLDEQSASIGRDLAARATDLILLNDQFALQQLLTATLKNNANVRYAFILDRQGNVIAHSFGDTFPMTLLQANQAQIGEYHHTVVLQTEAGFVWDTAVPIFEGRAGTARIGLSDAGIRAVEQTVTSQILLTTVLVAVIGMTAAMFLTWILTRPMLELVRATQLVAKGDFSPRVPRWADDELGELAEAFNAMTAELARTDEIRREREELRRQLLEKVIATQEDERRRIARELHDSTSQNLTSLMVGLRNLETMCGDPRIESRAAELRSVAAQTLDDVHGISMRLRPRLLDDLGLAAALERLTQEWQARYKIPLDLFIYIGQERLPGEVETAIYRIVQESLTNIARHAGAHSVSVLVERRGPSVITVVEDDGRGFDSLQSPGERHFGLAGMRERAELLGGKLTIESAPGNGTSIHVQVPLSREA